MVSAQIAALVVALSASGETTLLDFHAPWCGPCRSMEGTIADLERAGYPIRKVNIDQQSRLAKQYGVEGVPCFVMVVDGRESGRLTGAVSRRELVAMFTRAGVRPESQRREITRAQSPDPPAGGSVLPAINTRTPFDASGPDRSAAQTRGARITKQQAIDASVRLTIGDPQGCSHGSGTIIDARQGEALVATCGHIFRDSQGKGQISVDLCRPGGPQKLPGRLVSYNLESDVALVSIRPGVPVSVAPLAPRDYRIAEGDPVITVGCNNGGPATALESSITAVNKFRAPPNLSVAGLPVQGRSGGGLFSAEGRVIGVCNAADPADNEGLYAALAAIQDELDEAGLAEIYENPHLGDAQTALAAAADLPGPAEPRFAADATAGLVPAGVRSEAAAAGDSPSDRAEVICIVRSLSDPNAKSEVILLDRASADFMEQLAADRRAQEARHLTSLKVRKESPPAPRPRR